MQNHLTTVKSAFDGSQHRPRRSRHETLSSFYDRKATGPRKKPFCRACHNDGVLFDDIGQSMLCDCQGAQEREELELEEAA